MNLDRDESIRTLQRLVQFDSRTETPGESEVVEYVAERMSAHGLGTRLVDAGEGRLNAVGVWKGHGRGPRLMFNGHLDTNHVGEGWTVDPWEGRVADGHIYGIGVSNMKAGCAAYLRAVEELAAEGFQPAGDVVLTHVVGELQNGIGTLALLQDGWSADFFINCEPTDLAAMTMHAGSINFRVVLRGRTRHLSKREEAVDVIPAAMALVPMLNGLVFSGAEDPDHRAVNRCHIGLVRAGIGESLDESRPPQIADVAHLTGSARFAPGQTVAGVLEDIRREAAAVQDLIPGLHVEVLWLDEIQKRPYFPPFEAHTDSLLVRTLNQEWADLRGASQPTGLLFPSSFFGSDAAHLAATGMPGVVCGPGGQFNTMPDERVAVDDYLDAIQLYKRVIVRLCG
ncbi:M20 family metallopeptidase [Sediminivirga luteola]|uniref:Acetylornithine deacetylase n=1 Tax=Sediminivirga luteola TaxID=1774748 RepID=A0A8J2TV16_9MICO|nr:M20/M25/M40 family metallo-hydrolase [Sediminivirga luteola]GGA02577.1 acetylornithine deacetylase [Sediminivirga luteola]